MQNFDNQQQKLDEALNTLKVNEQNQDAAKDMAARVAEVYGNAGQAAQGAQNASNQAAQSDATQMSSQAAFNANGDPNAADANINTDFSEEELAAQNEAISEELDPKEYIADLNAQISTLQGQLDIAKAENAKSRDQMLRAMAEAENVRKRAAQDVERERKYALEKFVRSLLPIYDALEKAVELTDKDNEATKATYEGVVNTLNLFIKEVGSFGVELIDPTGKPFDPNFHQAVTMVPSNDVPNNHVLSTMQKGFLLNGRVVRPAMVVVAKAV